MIDFLHKWLGIPPDEQPPNHYRLLGLCVFEDDADVIDAAADKHLAFLHNLANGEYGEAAEELSNKISAARVLLLNRARKAKYDSTLRDELAVSGIQGTADKIDQTSADVAASGHQRLLVPNHASNATSSARQVNTASTPAIRNSPSGMNPAGVPVAGVVRVHGQRGNKRPKSGTRRRTQVSSWGSHLTRLSGLVAFAAVLYVGYGVWTGQFIFRRNALTRLFNIEGAQASVSAASEQPRVINRAADVISRKRSSKQSETPAEGELEDEFESALREATEKQEKNTSSAESGTLENGSLAIPSDEAIANEMSQIMQGLEENVTGLDNENPEEVARWFYIRALETASPEDQLKQLAYFTLAYTKLFELQKYESCLNVLDDIAAQYIAYPAKERKVGLIQEKLKYEAEVDRSLFLACCQLIERCASEGDFDTARVLSDALDTAQFADATQGQDFENFKKNYREFKDAFDAKQVSESQVGNLAGALPVPADSEALGIFHCFYSNDWEVGLKYLGSHEGKYRTPAALELAMASPIEIAESWEEVWKDEPLPLRRRAIGRRMLTNYNKHLQAKDYRVPTVLQAKVDNLVEKVFLRGQSSLVWGDDDFPRVLADKTRVFGRRIKASVSPGSAWNRSRLMSFMMPRGQAAGGAVAAIELENVEKIRVTRREFGSNSGAATVLGFILDYHTPGGYVKRVFLRFDKNYASKGSGNANVVQSIPWSDEVDFGASRSGRIPKRSGGKASRDELGTLGKGAEHTLVLRDWAPSNWDGRVWFMGYMKDAGPGYNLVCHVEW